MTLFGGIAGLAVDAMARPATRVRMQPGSYVNGRWYEPNVPAEDAIRAVIQAASESDLRQLPEGERTEAYVAIWTKADLRTADETTKVQADRVISELGDRWKVVRIVQRTEAGFIRAIGRMEHDRGRSV